LSSLETHPKLISISSKIDYQTSKKSRRKILPVERQFFIGQKSRKMMQKFEFSQVVFDVCLFFFFLSTDC